MNRSLMSNNILIIKIEIFLGKERDFLYVIVTYDVNVKRVNKVHKVLKRYLMWTQNSVFEGEIASGKFKELDKHLKNIIKTDEDSITYYKAKSRNFLLITFRGIKKCQPDQII